MQTTDAELPHLMSGFKRKKRYFQEVNYSSCLFLLASPDMNKNMIYKPLSSLLQLLHQGRGLWEQN